MKFLNNKEFVGMFCFTVTLLVGHVFIEPLTYKTLLIIGLSFLTLAITFYGRKRNYSNFFSMCGAVYVVVGGIGVITG
ncbi:hypothetical protein [Vibrio sp. TBV020]|uniref:hypothetical protein n=1 Tax=Vibrio sp. TBV020 TaxID=3137398 RepID=UPI0038CDB858